MPHLAEPSLELPHALDRLYTDHLFPQQQLPKEEIEEEA